MENENNIPEKIRQAGKELPFSVPGNYFEGFQDRLNERLAEEKSAPETSRIIRMLRPNLSLAAMMAGIALITFFGIRQILTSDRKDMMGTYELSEMIDFYMVEYEEEMLISTILESETEIELNPFENNSDEILDYLEAEGIDYSLLFDYN